MVSKHTDSVALRHGTEITAAPTDNPSTVELPPTRIDMPARITEPEDGDRPSHDNCDSRDDEMDPTISISSTSRIAGQTVAPFLAKHIPEQYAPLGLQTKSVEKNPSTKFCYRHRPDLLCRKTADEPSMENLQRVWPILSVYR